MDKLRFLQNVNAKDIWVRTTTEDRTYQVAGGMLYGMDNSMDNQPFKVHNEPTPVRNTSTLLLISPKLHN